MSFTVEDGTGLPDANALADVAFIDDYFTLRGNAEWTALTLTVKQNRIVLATDYIERKFYGLILGSKLKSDQSLSFPRQGEDAVPRGVKEACAEYAIRANDLALEFQVDASGKELQSKTVTAGPVTTSKTFFAGSKAFKKFPVPDAAMKPFVRSTSGAIR